MGKEVGGARQEDLESMAGKVRGRAEHRRARSRREKQFPKELQGRNIAVLIKRY